MAVPSTGATPAPSTDDGHAAPQAGWSSPEPSTAGTLTPSLTLPEMTLPKGGGAVRGIGEKFSVNAATGTGSLSVPLVGTPGRADFGPRLQLAYDSGGGNGPFGLGWSLGLPAITRKTDKGLPVYDDHGESDVFLVSGAEDLVPVLDEDGTRRAAPRTVHGVDYLVHAYRPRIEGLFARIERWERRDTGTSHWRSITRDNVTTVFGRDENARIADPHDARRIFAYLIELSYDDRGNAASYTYLPDDPRGVDLAAAHEATRDDAVRGTQRYLSTVRYGNAVPYFPAHTVDGDEPPLPAEWHFHLVLDYGNHADATPGPEPDVDWPVRPDPFSTYRAGFEVRTYRRCRRVLLFHHFPEEATAGAFTLTASSDLTYVADDAATDDAATGWSYSLLGAVTQTGYRRGDGAVYRSQSAAPLEFAYAPLTFHDTVTDVDPTDPPVLPGGLAAPDTHWIDLDGEGICGVLTTREGAWSYAPNLGGGRFATAEVLPTVPSPRTVGQARGQLLLDLTGTGTVDVVDYGADLPGYFARTDGGDWAPFAAFAALPAVRWDDPNLRFVDLDGDGRADVLVTEGDVLTWYPSRARDGFDPARTTVVPAAEDAGPRVVFADQERATITADMTGDGLVDIVRIRNGEVCYWPNLGYGRFGPKVTMDHSPVFDTPEAFDSRFLRPADVDGTGTTDLVYVGGGAGGVGGVRVWLNRAGNAFAPAHVIASVPPVDATTSLTVVDLLGSGTSCLVWSSMLPGDAPRPMRYVDLLGGAKPHLLTTVRNNLGSETRLSYASSTRFALADKAAGQAWSTKLPFPVHVIDRVETYDWVGRRRHVERYSYHEGCFDPVEREFRGFGMVEQRDTDLDRADTLFPEVVLDVEDAASTVPPILTRTWFHTGTCPGRDVVSRQHRDRYWTEPALRGDTPESAAAREALLLPDSVIDGGPDGALDGALDGDERREAYRALKGATLRSEVYAEDRGPRAEHPFTVAEQNFSVRRVQARGPNQHAVFVMHTRESLTQHYERVPEDPRVTHDVTLEIDEFAGVRRAVSVAYPRRPQASAADPDLSADARRTLAHDQARLHLGATANAYTNAVDRPDAYRVPAVAETVTAEFTGVSPAAARFTFAELDTVWTSLWTGARDVPYEEVPAADIDAPLDGAGADPAGPARRVVGRRRTRYRSDDLGTLLPPGELEPGAVPGESYLLALSAGLRQRVLGDRVTDAELRESGYVQQADDDGWWRPSGRTYYTGDPTDPPDQERATARAHFYRPRRAVDPFGHARMVVYDAYDLYPVQAIDAVGNVTAARIDYRVGGPAGSTDPNGNHAEVAYDGLGDVVGAAVSAASGAGDTLAGFVTDLDDDTVAAALAHPLDDPAGLLRGATSRFVPDRLAYWRTRADPQPSPVVTYTLLRETHASDLAPGEVGRFRHLFAYVDGLGRPVQQKSQAEAADDGAVRWVGDGWTRYDGKGRPTRTYEPFFGATHRFEPGPIDGAATDVLHDPDGRAVATLHPDATVEKTVRGPWSEAAWDANDMVLVSDPRTDADIGDAVLRRVGPEPGAFVSWFDRRAAGLGDTAEERADALDAAHKAAPHAATPTVRHLDPLGRTCLVVTDAGVDENGVALRFATRTALDTESKPLAVTDARGRRAMEHCLREPTPGGGFRYVAGYDLTGEPLYHNTIDSGERRMLGDVAGHLVHSWDARGQRFHRGYDALRRHTHTTVTRADGSTALLELSVFGERHPEADRNLKGRLFRHYDGAGVSGHERYDFTANLLESVRTLARHRPGGERPDWTVVAAQLGDGAVLDGAVLDVAALDNAAAPMLVEADRFVASSRFDALNRPVQLVLPHTEDGAPSVVRTAYNDANLLTSVHAWIRRADAPTELLDPAGADVAAVTEIRYNAHGQRLLVRHGNATVTTRVFDDATRRLRTLTTTRPHPDPDARTVQDLRYTYDPHGNITRLRDDADLHGVVFFRNQRVDPTADYRYDPIYRLIRATGREHLGQTGNGPVVPAQVTHDDAPRTQSAPGVPLLHPGDGNAMGTYTETYAYDAVGNLDAMIHSVAGGSWTRRYAYDMAGAITPTEPGNRLGATSEPGDPDGGPFRARYAYDPHGNVVAMPHLPLMVMGELDQLQATSRQVVTDGTPETTYYAYEAGGERLRKTTYRQAQVGAIPTRRTERIYLGAIEIYREFDGDGTLALERETLHVLLDHHRIVTAETRVVDTHGADKALPQLVRYQYGNHLGSVALELDDQAGVLSYEEYFPYGSTAYRAVRSQTDPPRGIRFTGEERDEETDLYYHGGRYYCPWLGRWTACDPAGMEDGPNPYLYVHANPVAVSDPTGMWGWREVAIVAAVVVVGTVVTVATAGVAAPLIAGAVASVGLTGAAATVATGVVVGAVAGAAGGAAGELTRQAASGEQISGKKIGQAALVGAALGAVTGGIGAYATTAGGAARAGAMSAAVRGSAVGRAGAAVARTASAGARAVARVPGVRQVATGAGAVARRAGQALGALEQGSTKVGMRLAQGVFKEGSRGAAATAAKAAVTEGTLASGAAESASAESTVAAEASSAADDVTFYTVQGPKDAARLRSGGTPFPTEPNRSALGEGVYSWGSRADAEKYLDIKFRQGIQDLEVMPFDIARRDLESLRSVDIDALPDPEAFMAKYSKLWDGTPDHGFEYIKRGADSMTEHFFDKSIFDLLKFD